MKKCLSLVMLCLITTVGFAQNSFYATIQAGPSIAYSESSYYTNSKWTTNYGIGVGYEFPNELIRVETGVARTNIFTIFDLYGYMGSHANEENKVYLSRDSWQIPVRFKLKFWQPADKITFRAITGIVLSLTPDDYKLEGTFINRNQQEGETSFQTNSSAQLNTTYLFYGNSIGAVDSNWLIESGLEISYRLSDKLSGNTGIVYQGGLQTKYGGVIYERYTDPVSGKTRYTSEALAASEANALNLYVSLTYAVGK